LTRERAAQSHRRLEENELEGGKEQKGHQHKKRERMASSGGEAGAKEGMTTTTAASTSSSSSSPSPRLRGDSITDEDPWIANKRLFSEGGEEKTGGRGGLPGVLSPRFLKRSKRSETTSASRDKGLVVEKEKGKKKRSGVSADDLNPIGRRDPTAAALDEPKVAPPPLFVFVLYF
jgi:hypothetical protein